MQNSQNGDVEVNGENKVDTDKVPANDKEEEKKKDANTVLVKHENSHLLCIDEEKKNED